MPDPRPLPPVLVVDDDPVSRRLLHGLVSAAGHRVREATDGESALSIIASGVPRIVLADWEMPRMTGPQLCRHARRLPLERPPHLVMVTMHQEMPKLVEAFGAGVDDFLSKPVHEEELRVRLRAWTRLIGLQDELVEKHAQTVRQNQQLAAANAQLHDLAIRDPLTGLPNRRAATARLEEAWAAEGAALSCVMIDVDRFKEINDRLGHGAGDAVLCHLARVLRAAVPPGGGAFRLGGDEFLLLCPGADAGAGAAAAARCADRLRERPCTGEGGPIVATLSAGVAERVPGMIEPACLLAAADARLYAAKEAGRDEVRAA